MFASALGSSVSQRQAGAYRNMNVASVVDSASPHQLVAMLFDGALGAIAEARGAIRSRNVVQKGKAITRAVGIVDEGLRAALNLDQGGPLAADLHALYGYINLRLTQANLKSDEGALEECSQLIEALRSGWAQIANHAAV
jgi:flagellar secretion chaperone FliS